MPEKAVMRRVQCIEATPTHYVIIRTDMRPVKAPVAMWCATAMQSSAYTPIRCITVKHLSNRSFLCRTCILLVFKTTALDADITNQYVVPAAFKKHHNWPLKLTAKCLQARCAGVALTTMPIAAMPSRAHFAAALQLRAVPSSNSVAAEGGKRGIVS
eukprot:18194-Heterococcus_DN1.PRE.5